MRVEEILISRRALVSALVGVAAVLLVFIGTTVSPRDDTGHPLLLSLERRAILRYLRSAEDWAERLDDAGSILDDLVPEAPATEASELPATPPAGSPGGLYEQAHRAQRALEMVVAVQVEVEREKVPASLTGLHGLVMQTVEDHRTWADAVLAYVGAPDLDQVTLLSRLRQNGLDSLETLNEVLRRGTTG